MLDRCRNPAHRHFHHYGGRGIAVCERWNSFENFLADMGDRPNGTTLDRIDVNGNYEPSNCRWATSAEQAGNKRSSILLDYGGEQVCLEHLAKRLGLAPQTLDRRIKAGWPPDKWAAPARVSANHISRRGARALPLAERKQRCPLRLGSD